MRLFASFLVYFLCGLLNNATAQNSILEDTSQISPVTITPNYWIFIHKNLRENQNRTNQNINNITSQVSEIPGVYSFNMGNGNAKPVLRGFSGNRISILVDGLKLDNQQWQDEHGLTISAFENDQIIVSLGNNNTAFGGDAFGGAILINHKVSQKNNSLLFCQLSSNTQGLLINGQIEKIKKNQMKWFNFQIHQESDYFDAKLNPILNSRNRAIQAKIGKTIIHKNKTQYINYRFSMSQIGIARIFDSTETNEIKNSEPYDFEGPNHIVGMQTWVKNTIYNKKNGKLFHGFGLITNTRIEMENGNLEGLGLQLTTLQHNIQRSFTDKLKFQHTLIHRIILQNNFNFGTIWVIPNINLINYSFSDIIYKKIGSFEITQSYNYEWLNYLNMSTFSNPNLNIQFEYPLNKSIKLKNILSISHRNPNLHELYANGMSEDAFRFDKGNSKLLSEKMKQLEFQIEYQKNRIEFQGNIYFNQIHNFIVLQNSHQFLQGMPVYNYTQFNSEGYGFELNLKNKFIQNKLNVISNFSATHLNLNSQLSDIYFPPNRFTNKIEFTGIKNFKLYLTHIRLFNLPKYNLNKEYSCNLIHASIEYTSIKNTISIAISNLTNQTYIDQLSLLRIYPYYAKGRDIKISIKHLF